VSEDDSQIKLYELTKPGKHFRQKAQNRAFARLQHKIETLEEELVDEKDELDSWVQEHLISVHPSDRERDPHP
jgi:hypothetical protein